MGPCFIGTSLVLADQHALQTGLLCSACNALITGSGVFAIETGYLYRIEASYSNGGYDGISVYIKHNRSDATPGCHLLHRAVR